jgi:hypothetical protein
MKEEWKFRLVLVLLILIAAVIAGFFALASDHIDPFSGWFLQ